MALGKILIVAGVILIGLGFIVILSNRLSIPLGHLPGDLRIERRGFQFYFPLATCILLSILFSLILRFFKK